MNSKVETTFNPDLKIWSGMKQKDLYGDEMTLGEVALHVLSRHPEKIVQVMDSTSEQLTGAQLIRKGTAIARNLQKLGLKVGDVVGINAANNINIPALALGALLCGTPINAMFNGYDKKMLKPILDMARPRLVFCELDTYAKTRAAVDELQLSVEFVLLNGHVDGVKHVEELLTHDALEDLKDTTYPCAQLNGDSTAIILCSSGTTSAPKGVICSHKILINRQIFLNLPTDAVLYTFSSLHWASGWMFLATSFVNGVKQIITDKPFTPEYLADVVERQRITHVMIATNQAISLQKNTNVQLEKSFGHVSSILCGGSKVPKLVSQNLNATLVDSCGTRGIMVGYAMSELFGIALNDSGARQEGSEGKLMPNTEVRVVDKKGELLGPNEEGILHVRIPYMWAGYYRNPEVTLKSKSNGDWVITGDIGSFDDEGFLHIRSRDNDVFKSEWFQIYPADIEGVLLHLSGILEVCIFGIPDPEAINLIACAVVRTPNEQGRSLAAEQIEQHFRENLSAIYRLRGGVHFMDALPRTSSGKVQRNKVLELVRSDNHVD